MNSGGVVLCTLALNEMEWLPRLWQQHKDWPELRRWVFVEGADRAYAAANPGMVGDSGLSMDGTTEWLDDLAASNKDLVTCGRVGFYGSEDGPQGKCEARQHYLELANELEPEFVITLDADEFYTFEDQRRVIEVMRSLPDKLGYIFKRREIWRPPLMAAQPLCRWEVVGGFWAIPCCHWWRWQPGMHYADNHNTPADAEGRPLSRGMVRLEFMPNMPQMVHLGFASRSKTRLAKNAYYVARGEGSRDHRAWYVESRAAWEAWSFSNNLPRGARVKRYDGPVPEVFR